jgi:predicted TIM-barrel fold metal-dependent hydrolase
VIIDVNANLFRWPFRRSACDEVPGLLAAMKRYGVGQAWVANLEGVFHKDVNGVNRRLVEACRPHPELVPFGTVNPALPDWREDLRRCQESYRMPGVRLHPNYHGYKLGDAAFGELLERAQRRGLLVELVVRMEDPRAQHPLAQVADVDLAPLAGVLAARPGGRLVLLNAPALKGPLAKRADVWVDMAMREGVGGVGDLVRSMGAGRVLFGSHVPLFVLDSAVLKIREADLTAEQRQALESGTARALLGRSG